MKGSEGGKGGKYYNYIITSKFKKKSFPALDIESETFLHGKVFVPTRDCGGE